LSDAGAEAALGGGELGADDEVGHTLYQYCIQDKRRNQGETRNANLPGRGGPVKTGVYSDVWAG
jgi:hypothetical protein